MNRDEAESGRYRLWQLTQALIEHAMDYTQNPATLETTGAIVADAAEVERQVGALLPHLGHADAEIQRGQRVLERIKNILRVHEALPGAALLVDYQQDYYSPN